jgi:hypothetical protein
MKKKWIAALLLSVALTMAGCTNAGTTPEAEGQSVSSESSEAGKTDASKEADASKEESSTVDSSTASSEPDGMVSAGSKEDMGIDDSWKGIYADYLEKEIVPMLDAREEGWKEGWSFGLIYVNDDPTPELVISSGYEAAGNIICTVVDGQVAYLQTARLSFFYKEFGNVLDNADGNMGYYYDNIYKIGANGFELLHEGTNEEVYGENGPTGEMQYVMDGRDVTKDEYYKTVNGAIPATERTFWNTGSSYDDMLSYLKGKGAASYQEAYREVIQGLSSKDAVTDRASENYKFALIERENYDPLLLCVGNQTFCFYAFEDGLLQAGPNWWFSETELVFVYPKLGIIQNHQYFENNVSNVSDYWMKAGSLCATYLSTECELDEEWEPVFDENGMPITIYEINNAEVSKEDYYKFAERNDEKFKQQLAPNDAEYTFIEYYDAAQMLEMLK